MQLKGGQNVRIYIEELDREFVGHIAFLSRCADGSIAIAVGEKAIIGGTSPETSQPGGQT